jgi:acyl-CoA reductase-like NAD-dependent aldehyde dehydrogenase
MAAHAAFEGWKQMPGNERALLLRRWFDLITLHTEDLGVLLAREEGKPLARVEGRILTTPSGLRRKSAKRQRRQRGRVVFRVARAIEAGIVGVNDGIIDGRSAFRRRSNLVLTGGI